MRAITCDHVSVMVCDRVSVMVCVIHHVVLFFRSFGLAVIVWRRATVWNSVYIVCAIVWRVDDGARV